MNLPKKIGVFSGTFDPFHNGHIELCLATMRNCDIDKIIILVEKSPFRKTNVLNYKDRQNMIELAVKKYKNISVVDTPTDNISIDNTLPILQKRFPDAKYWYIAGSDVLNHFLSWHNVAKLIDNMSLCVVCRNGSQQESIEQELKQFKKTYPNLAYCVIPKVSGDVSSSMVRHQITETGSSNSLCPEVLNYIQSNQLYKS